MAFDDERETLPGRLSREQADRLRPRIAQFRMVFYALLAGVVLFGVIVFLISGSADFTWPPSTLGMILAGISLPVLLQGLVLPGIFRKAATRDLSGSVDEKVERLVGTWFASSLIGAAMVESAAFFNLIGYIIEPNMIHFALAGIAWLFMWAHFPSFNRTLDWIESVISGRN